MVLLISGKMGSGKTTLAEAVREAWLTKKRRSVCLINFADALYDMHNYCRDYLLSNGVQTEKKDRKLLQWLGTEWGRAKSESIWVDIVKSKIEKLTKESRAFDKTVSPLFIIADCRFPNELSGFPDAVSVRLECDRELRKERCSRWSDAGETHLSETALDLEHGFNFTFDTGKMPVKKCVDWIIARLEIEEKKRNDVQSTLGTHQ